MSFLIIVLSILLGVVVGHSIIAGLFTCFLSWIFLMKKTDIFFYVVLVSLTFHHQRMILFNVSVRYADMLLIIFLIYYIIFEIQTIKELFVNKTALSFTALIFLVLTISQIQSIYIDFPITTIRPGAVANYPFIKSIIRILQLVFLFTFSLCVAHYSTKRSFEKTMQMHTNVATGVSLLLIIIFLSHFIFPFNPLVKMTATYTREEFFIRMNGFFSEPTVLALYLLTSIPFVGVFFFLSRSRKEFAKLCIQSICLFITFSRAGWMSAAAMVVLFIIFFGKEHIFAHKKQLSFAAIMLVLCFLVLFISSEAVRVFTERGVFDHFTNALDVDSKKFWSTRLRLEAYSAAVSAFQMHPFMGIGIFNFHFYGGFRNYDLLHPTLYVNYSEINNIILLVITELGIVGVLFFSYCFFLIIRCFLRIMRDSQEKEKIIAKGICISLISLFVIMQFTSTFTYPFFWFFYGVILSFIAETNKSQMLNSAAKDL